MGHSVGHWEDDTLVVERDELFNDKNWFDRAGQFPQRRAQVVERYLALIARRHLVRSDDRGSEHSSRAPWTIAMPLYRRLEAELDSCSIIRAVEFVGGVPVRAICARQPLVTHWEGETMSVDVKRKVPPGDTFYAWFRK